MDVTFIFIAQKDEKVKVKYKHCPGWKQLSTSANVKSTAC